MSNTITTNYSVSRIISQTAAHILTKFLFIATVLLVLSACTGANENRDEALSNIIPLSSSSVTIEASSSASANMEKTSSVFSQSSRVGMLP